MEPESSFEELIGRLRTGDNQAADKIFRRFARRLIGLARTRLNGDIRMKVDPEDVMQSVFHSFFRRAKDDEFELKDWDSLWALLALITLRKCGHHIRRHLADCRDVNREVHLALENGDSAAPFVAIGREPTPSEVAILTELIESMMRGLSGKEREIVVLSLQGYTAPEISNHVGRSERTIHRVLKRVRGQLQEARDDQN